jgi:hypothetical protein
VFMGRKQTDKRIEISMILFFIFIPPFKPHISSWRKGVLESVYRSQLWLKGKYLNELKKYIEIK